MEIKSSHNVSGIVGDIVHLYFAPSNPWNSSDSFGKYSSGRKEIRNQLCYMSGLKENESNWLLMWCEGTFGILHYISYRRTQYTVIESIEVERDSQVSWKSNSWLSKGNPKITTCVTTISSDAESTASIKKCQQWKGDGKLMPFKVLEQNEGNTK